MNNVTGQLQEDPELRNARALTRQTQLRAKQDADRISSNNLRNF